MYIRNSVNVLEHIPPEETVLEVNLHDNNLPSVKTLGLLWKTKGDILTFKANPLNEKFNCTKWNYLRKIAMLCKPFEFLGPYDMQAKETSTGNVDGCFDCHDHLTEELVANAEKLFKELTNVSLIDVQRCHLFQGDLESTYLHNFVDASFKEAYGAVVHLTFVNNDETVSIIFVTTKSKVSPLTTVSISRPQSKGVVLGLS